MPTKSFRISLLKLLILSLFLTISFSYGKIYYNSSLQKICLYSLCTCVRMAPLILLLKHMQT